MREADRLTINAGIDSYSLMQNAGRAVAEEITEYLDNRKALVLCGPGNNGGDGFVIARILSESGWRVRLACFKTISELGEDALRAAHEWKGEILPFDNIEIDENEVIVDAVFGTGFRGTLPAPAANLFSRLRKARPVVIAVDIPSGVNGNTGQADENTLNASMTVTFFRKKLGQVLMPGMAYCGPIAVHDIGIQTSVLTETGVAAYENHPMLWRNKVRRKSYFDNKYTLGHLIVLGGPDMTGAALLAAHSAMRIRTGICTIVGPGNTADVYRSYLPGLIFESYETLDSFSSHLQDDRRNAAILGPGAGRKDKEGLRKAVLDCLAMGENKSLVLDADALNVFQGQREEFFELLHKKCVLTPHEGEFERLFDDLEGIKPIRAIEAAALCGAVIVFKGADTIIATPDGKCIVNTNGPPLLATAGSGDVLAGMIAGLMAQGVPAFEASCASAWIQGEAAYSFGPGLIASDLPDLIPAVLRELT